MTLTIRPLHPTLAAEVTGVDFREPVSAEVAAQLVTASDRYPVLVLPRQAIDDEQQVRFASLYGALESGGVYRKPDDPRRTHDKITDISNIDGHGNLRSDDDDQRIFALADRLWHTDSSFMTVPAKYSMLHARVVPPSGHSTEFADLRAAYDALGEAMKERIEDLVAEHSIAYSRSLIGFTYTATEAARRPPVRQRIVRVHPGSGRKTLYLASHASHIVGWAIPDGRSLLLDLIDHATQPQFVYRHEWDLGDLVWWDDRCSMHRARPRDTGQVRDMRRATISDVASTLDQPHAMAG